MERLFNEQILSKILNKMVSVINEIKQNNASDKNNDTKKR